MGCRCSCACAPQYPVAYVQQPVSYVQQPVIAAQPPQPIAAQTYYSAPTVASTGIPGDMAAQATAAGLVDIPYLNVDDASAMADPQPLDMQPSAPVVSTPTVVPATYMNPVYDHDAPDPSIIRADDGNYYAYTTRAGYPYGLVESPILSSPDLVHWNYAANALTINPTWSTGNIWAPHIQEVGGNYNLYYTAQKPGGGDNHAIGVATSTSPTGPFVDSGAPLIDGTGIGSIDPFVMSDDDGRLYMYWGSGGQPLKAQELSADGLHLIGEAHDVLVPTGAESDYERLIEGAWITKHEGYYYLMYSGDRYESHYAVKAARSTSPFGPFERDPSGPIITGNDTFQNPGHNSTIKDAAGQDWMVYHAFKGADRASRVMLLDKIDWSGGWPHVAGPSTTAQTTPTVDAQRGASGGGGVAVQSAADRAAQEQIIADAALRDAVDAQVLASSWR